VLEIAENEDWVGKDESGVDESWEEDDPSSIGGDELKASAEQGENSLDEDGVKGDEEEVVGDVEDGVESCDDGEQEDEEDDKEGDSRMMEMSSCTSEIPKVTSLLWGHCASLTRFLGGAVSSISNQNPFS